MVCIALIRHVGATQHSVGTFVRLKFGYRAEVRGYLSDGKCKVILFDKDGKNLGEKTLSKMVIDGAALFLEPKSAKPKSAKPFTKPKSAKPKSDSDTNGNVYTFKGAFGSDVSGPIDTENLMEDLFKMYFSANSGTVLFCSGPGRGGQCRNWRKCEETLVDLDYKTSLCKKCWQVLATRSGLRQRHIKDHSPRKNHVEQKLARNEERKEKTKKQKEAAQKRRERFKQRERDWREANESREDHDRQALRALVASFD